IHCNSFSDPAAGGSLVLYPGPQSLPFAQSVSDLLGRDLGPGGVGDDGVQLRDNWWIHNPMPTATAEIAYLSNPREPALLPAALVRWREPVTHVTVIAGSITARVLQGTLFRRWSGRRRRRRARAEVLVRGRQRWTRTHSVYDELSL